MTQPVPAEEKSEIQVTLSYVSSSTDGSQSKPGPQAKRQEERPMMRIPLMNCPQRVALPVIEPSTNAFDQPRSQEVGSASPIGSDCLYQVATIAAAILVLMSI